MAWIYDIDDKTRWGYGGAWDHMSANQKNNVDIIYSLCSQAGMTKEALAGMLGNMDAESYINPGQGEIGWNMSPQYGLGIIQWTPNHHIGSNPLQDYASAVGGAWFDGNIQIQKILTGEPGSWLTTSQYPYTWAEFCALTDYEEATKAYFWERERGTWDDIRVSYAYDWLEYLGGEPPIPPEPPTPTTDDEFVVASLFMLDKVRYKR